MRGVIAESLCEQDREAALALLEPLEPPTRDRYLSNVARRVAKTDPEGALEILAGYSGHEIQRERALARVLPFFLPDSFDLALEHARGISSILTRCQALIKLSFIAPADQVPVLIEEAADALAGEGTRDSAEGGTARQYAEALACVACVARRLGHQPYDLLALKAAPADRGASSASVLPHRTRTTTIRL